MPVVGLVQINVDFSSTYLPYSVGTLQAYALTDPEISKAYTFLDPIYKREQNLDPLVDILVAADIVGFSAYVWNTSYSLEIARKLKERNPKTLIVFGGPNVPDNAEAFLRRNPAVDVAIHGEGEKAFLEILRGYLAGDWIATPSARFVDRATGKFQMNPKVERIKDLTEVPSPYLAGVFEGIMRKNPDQTWNVLWETNRGCPFSCSYCDWGSATQSKLNKFEIERLMSEMNWFKDNKVEYLMCADANFGIIERDIDIASRLAELKKQYGYPAVFAATYTKNATERSYKIGQILMEAGLIRGYTVSTQSVDEETLKNVRRENISQKTFNVLQMRFNRDKLPTYTDLIIGLPGETYESFAQGITAVINRGQYNKIYFIILSILPNAPMADPEYRKKFGLKTIVAPQKNLHEKVREDSTEITEYQELVIATASLKEEDWRRTMCLAWMVSFLYFDKLLHIPLTLLTKLSSIPFHEVADSFIFDADRPEYPFLSRINKLFRDKAYGIQNKAEIEYSTSDDWLKIWWQPDKMAFMEACKDIDRFYTEAEHLLQDTLQKHSLDALAETVKEAISLNKVLVRSPFKPRPASINLHSNIYDYYVSILEQAENPLQAGTYTYYILDHEEKWANTDEWCKRVVWFGNKTSAYLSKCSLTKESESQGDGYNPAVLKPYFYS